MKMTFWSLLATLVALTGCLGFGEDESPATAPVPEASASPSPTPSEASGDVTVDSGDVTAPVPSASALSVSIDPSWGHLNVTVPYATDDTTAREDLIYEVRMAHSSSASLATAATAAVSAGVVKELQMGAGETEKMAKISLAPAASYAVTVTVRDEAGNRAVYTQKVNTSVGDWQALTNSASSFAVTSESGTTNGPGARVGHEAVYFNSNFYVIAGIDNSSAFPTDLVNFRSSNEAWTIPSLTVPSNNLDQMRRAFFGAVTHTHSGTEKIYIGGGEGPSVPHTNILSSANGSTWSIVTSSVPFLPRTDFEFVSHGGNLYAIGGETYISSVYAYKNDIWKSTDGGVNWTEVNAGSRFAGRKDFSAFSMKDCLWVLGGRAVVSGSPVDYRDVWKSCDDGATWAEASAAAPFATKAAKAAPLAYGLFVAGVIENRTEMMCAFGGRNGATDDGSTYCSYDGAVWFTYKSVSGLHRNDLAVASGGGYFFVFGGTDQTFSGSPNGYPTFGSTFFPF